MSRQEVGRARLLRVRRWDEAFESAKSRTYGIKGQTYMPNKQGLGYVRIVREPGGPGLYGAWCAMINLLSRQSKPRQGYLTDTGRIDGCPYSAADIADLTLMPPELVQRMLELCTSQAVGWLEVVYGRDTARTPCGPSPNPNPEPSSPPLQVSQAAAASPESASAPADAGAPTDARPAAPPGASAYDRIVAKFPAEVKPPTREEVLVWASAYGMKLEAAVEQVLADIGSEPPNRWNQYGGKLVKFALANAASLHERKSAPAGGRGYRAQEGDTGPSDEWTRAYSEIADAIWRAKESGEGGEAIRRAMQKARDTYGDVPKHRGKHVVDCAIEMAMNNLRPVVAVGK
jgi:hypothetical protein